MDLDLYTIVVAPLDHVALNCIFFSCCTELLALPTDFWRTTHRLEI